MAKRGKRATKCHNAPNKSKMQWAWLLVFIVVLFCATIRIRLLPTPLERDEGEYAYAGQLILQGIPPYVRVYNMKLPGTYAVYAIAMALFGQNPTGIHLGLLFVNATTIILVFLLARKLFDTLTGLVASASFGILSLGASVLGVFAHATHFVTLPAIGGLLLLLKAKELRSRSMLFWSGLCLGLAFLMKQHGIFFVIFGASYILIYNAHFSLRQEKIGFLNQKLVDAAIFLLGAAVPLVLTCLILLLTGALQKFWFWTWTYALQYVTETSFSTGCKLFRSGIGYVVQSAPALWILAGLGLICLFADREWRKRAPFVGGLLLFSFFAICPGFYFRSHYFIVVLPVLAILNGIAVSTIYNIAERIHAPIYRKAAVLAFLLILGYSIFQQKTFLFKATPCEVCRLSYGAACFPEALEVGKYIRENSTKDDRIVVLGSEPEIYFYSRRMSATGYIYMYPLMESSPLAEKMQREMIKETMASRPKFLIAVCIPTSWMRRRESPTLLFDWFNQYSTDNYQLVGSVEILSLERTEYRWGEELNAYKPKAENRILVFMRRQ
ncbi:MAG: glycosyltransferase family 39 protein [Armatimonadetes bacterium]|nr:glycosyltransferase family 39 protein [Armatimonadota bacterium]